MFELRALGGLTLLADSAAPVAVPRRRLALLAVVATAGDRGVSRDRLISLFWPDQPAASGRHSLDQLLSLIRREVAEAAFLGIDPLRINAATIRPDVLAVATAAKRGDDASVVAEYGGPFLDDVFIRGSVEFEHWADGERARFRQLYQDALARLAEAAAARDDFAAAARWWRFFALADPLSARGAMALMRALAAAGDRAAALSYSREYETLVRQQLDLAPDRAVMAFVEQMRGTTESAPAGTSRAPMTKVVRLPSAHATFDTRPNTAERAISARPAW